MRRTTGQLVWLAAVGAGFGLAEDDSPKYGTEQPDGTVRVVMVHPDDGRILTLTTRPGDGWQCGKLISAVGTGKWRSDTPGELPGSLTATTYRQVRAMLRAHEPGREQPYCGGDPIRQPRALDGQERDILYRILRDVLNALNDPELNPLLLRVIALDRHEVGRLVEMKGLLDTRDD